MGQRRSKSERRLPDRWVHLAAVVERGRGAVWMDGRKSGEFLFDGAVASILSVAVDAEGGRAFRGSIYEIRYGTFADGAFSPETDLSLHAMRSEARTAGSAEARAALVAGLEAPGYGKEIVRALSDERRRDDWLIRPVRQASRLYVQLSEDRQDVRFRLDNGLVSRTFYLGDNIACISYKNKSEDAEYLRAVKPEARIRIDTAWYDVGGLVGQPEMSYLLEEWLPQMTAAPGAFVLEKIETGVPVERYPWSRKFHAPAADWPPKGLRLTLTFAAPGDVPQVEGVEVRVHYEIYDGLPVVAKWIEVVNDGAREFLLRDMECEVLAVNQDRVSRMHVESDYSFALANADLQGSALMHYAGDPKVYHVGRSTTRWVPSRLPHLGQPQPGRRQMSRFPAPQSAAQQAAHGALCRGIVMGGYELQIASRGRGDSVDCVHPETGRPGSLFGQSVCVASAWQDIYISK